MLTRGLFSHLLEADDLYLCKSKLSCAYSESSRGEVNNWKSEQLPCKLILQQDQARHLTEAHFLKISSTISYLFTDFVYFRCVL